MALTYQLIASNTLSSSAASVTFSSIPSTYTDLVLKLSMRDNRTGNTATRMSLQFNGDTSLVYSTTVLSGTGSTAASSRSSGFDYIFSYFDIDGPDATANTFSNVEIYIPSYTASQNKPISIFGAQENNTTGAFMATSAGLWRNTAAITSIKIDSADVQDFVSGSSFFLYGIKNS